MGNQFKRMEEPPNVKLEPVETFKFHEPLSVETNNGLHFNDFYLPEEVVAIILSYIPPKEILKVTLVCKKWCNIIKSDAFWMEIYSRRYKNKPKKLPWYVYYCLMSTDYFDTNLIKNGNGQDGYKYWKIVLNYGDQFKIEDPPSGSDPLPLNVPEFNGKTSCFATSFYECNKLQEISFEKSRLMQLILNKYRPHIYVSEWVAARFDCGCTYSLICKLFGKKMSSSNCEQPEDDSDDSGLGPEEPLYAKVRRVTIEQWAGSTWSKVEMLLKGYPSGINRIVFQHEGRDTQFWKGHYGSKMAGGVVKILFNSIEPRIRNCSLVINKI